MNAAQLVQALAICIDARMPAHITSEPGVGKSSLVRAVGRALERRVIDQRCVQMDAVDARGMPAVIDGRTAWARPAWLPTEPGAIIFLDELVQATPMVQNAMSELILDRTLGGEANYKLPADTAIIAAGNRRTDRAATNEMPSQLRNRFIHLPLEQDVESWVSWAMKPDTIPAVSVPKVEPQETIHELVMAFIRFRPNLLQAFDANAVAFPTSRSVEFVSRLMPYLVKNDELLFPMTAGCCGEGWATEFTAFLQLIREMPDPDLVFRNPTQAPIPESPSILYALCTALAARVTDKTASALFTYVTRLPGDFNVMTIKDALARMPKLLKTSEGLLWAVKHGNLFTGG